MTKKVALACALIHAPRLLVLDEPFEAVDPVSASHDPAASSTGFVRQRRHGRPLQPRDGPGRADLHRRRDHRRRRGAGGRHRSTRSGRARRSRTGSSTWSGAATDVGRGWRGCAPPPTEAAPAAQRPAPQRAAVVGMVARGLYGGSGWSSWRSAGLVALRFAARRRARPLGRGGPRRRGDPRAGSRCRCCSPGWTRPSTRCGSRPSRCPAGSCSPACWRPRWSAYREWSCPSWRLTTRSPGRARRRPWPSRSARPWSGVLTCVAAQPHGDLRPLGRAVQTRRGRELASAAGGVLLVASVRARQRMDRRAGQPARPAAHGRRPCSAGRRSAGLGAPADVAAGALGTGLLRLLLAVVRPRPAAGACGTCCCAGPWRTPRLGRARAEAAGRPAPGGSPACPARRRAPSPHARSPTGAATPATSFHGHDAACCRSRCSCPPLAAATPGLLGMPLVAGYLLGWGQHNDVGVRRHARSGCTSPRRARVGRPARPAGAHRGARGRRCVSRLCRPQQVLTGRWPMLPATWASAWPSLLTGFGVASVLSAVKQYPVPAPGESPFASPPGPVGVTMRGPAGRRVGGDRR